MVPRLVSPALRGVGSPRVLVALVLLAAGCFADHPPPLGSTGTTGEATTTTTTGATEEPTTGTTGPPPGCPSTMPPGTWYIDQDSDSWAGEVEVIACDQPPGTQPEPGDCDDDDAKAYPGAVELCDGSDDDCDGITDEYSEKNTTCGGCTLAEREGAPYWFCVASPIDWVAARKACMVRGPTVDLASIHSAEDNTFAGDQALAALGGEPTGPFWIGLRRRDPDWKLCAPDVAQWEWSDGTSVDFVAWSAGQPDNGGAVCEPACEPIDVVDPDCPYESCGELLFMGGWNDGLCSGAGVGYVCRAPPPP